MIDDVPLAMRYAVGVAVYTIAQYSPQRSSSVTLLRNCTVRTNSTDSSSRLRLSVKAKRTIDIERYRYTSHRHGTRHTSPSDSIVTSLEDASQFGAALFHIV